MSAQPAVASQALVIGTDEGEVGGVARSLAAIGCQVTPSGCGEEALAILQEHSYDLVVLLACKAGCAGLEVLLATRAIQSRAQVIVVALDDAVDTAVQAMQSGAYDYLTRPLRIDELVLRTERALRLSRLQCEIAARRRTNPGGGVEFVGETPAVQRLLGLAERAAATRATVLLVGETGTGKDCLARTIHSWSPRNHQPFVTVSCSALPETLLESELFGHTRGSFTGAVTDHTGLFEHAQHGTILLDEIESLSPTAQAKLLRVVEERTIQRVGDGRARPVDFRLIAAANRELDDEVAQGRFREDLWYRLNVITMHLPPLRERRDDIRLLAVHFRDLMAAELELEPVDIPPPVLERLTAYEWPGNVRELRNWVERALVLATSGAELPLPRPHANHVSGEWSWDRPLDERWSLRKLQQEYIDAVLDRTRGHRSRAAQILGIDRRTLYRRHREHRNTPAG
ncbi:MAG: sigma-54-dependent Fis family transcriptional regulator [Gemmatimonadota bacterium]|nr:MAG: sigma-54-dependent Fis family transcriptional regulator [Gemmatimonadota bacterium]